jgi:hypothetical protein
VTPIHLLKEAIRRKEVIRHLQVVHPAEAQAAAVAFHVLLAGNSAMALFDSRCYNNKTVFFEYGFY